MGVSKGNTGWTSVLGPGRGLFDFRLSAVWRYRDLLVLLVYRDFVSLYKQTILGPLWFILQPVLTTITFALIFGRLAGLSTDGLPPILFYLSGLTLWTYFADCLVKTSNTFVSNASVFGKVYFPRIIVPLSVLISSMIKLGIQFLIFIAVWLYYYNTTDAVHPQWAFLWLIPLLVVLLALLGLGTGLLISSMTTKYRDLSFLVSFGVQLLMYASPIVYPMSMVPAGMKEWLWLNPVAHVIETFKYVFLGTGTFNAYGLLYAAALTLFLLLFSMVLFNRVERNFIDTV